MNATNHLDLSAYRNTGARPRMQPEAVQAGQAGTSQDTAFFSFIRLEQATDSTRARASAVLSAPIAIVVVAMLILVLHFSGQMAV